MTMVAEAMEIVFLSAVCVAAAAWIYSVRYFMPMWAVGFRKTKDHKGYMRKTLIGTAVFFAAIAVGFAAGGIGEYWGGGRD